MFLLGNDQQMPSGADESANLGRVSHRHDLMSFAQAQTTHGLGDIRLLAVDALGERDMKFFVSHVD
jgi:hypothetical protein